MSSLRYVRPRQPSPLLPSILPVTVCTAGLSLSPHDAAPMGTAQVLRKPELVPAEKDDDEEDETRPEQQQGKQRPALLRRSAATSSPFPSPPLPAQEAWLIAPPAVEKGGKAAQGSERERAYGVRPRRWQANQGAAPSRLAHADFFILQSGGGGGTRDT